MKNEAFKSLEEVVKRYSELIEGLRMVYAVDYVVNYDILALSSHYKLLNIGDFNSFEMEQIFIPIQGFKPSIRTNGEKRVLEISFQQIAENFDMAFSYVTGYNKASTPMIYENGIPYDSHLKIIIAPDEERYEYLRKNYESSQLEEKAWKHFKTEVKPKMNSQKLGERFEILEPIYWHFLEVLPPYYGKNCFLCSEACFFTPEGKTVYYCLRKTGNTFTIEYNTRENVS